MAHLTTRLLEVYEKVTEVLGLGENKYLHPSWDILKQTIKQAAISQIADCYIAWADPEPPENKRCHEAEEDKDSDDDDDEGNNNNKGKAPAAKKCQKTDTIFPFRSST